MWNCYTIHFGNRDGIFSPRTALQVTPQSTNSWEYVRRGVVTMQIGMSTARMISCEDLATECGFVADKLNNLLTAIQLKAGLLIEVSSDALARERLRDIVAIAEGAASYSTRLRNLSDAKIQPGY